MQDLINLITNNGIGIVCVAYLIYFQSTTMNKMLSTLESMDNRLLLIENKIEKGGNNQWNYQKMN
jgi:hypothetical protein